MYKTYKVNNLGGMLQRQDADQIAENQSPLLINISHAKPGTWSKRKGTELLATTQAGNGVYGLIDYRKNDSSHSVRAVRSTDLDSYSVGGNSWSALDSAQFTASTKVSSVNYKNRVYHVSVSDNLCYESGASCTDVGAGGDEIKARQIVAVQNTLFVCGQTDNEEKVFYSLYDTANNVPGDQLWTDDEGSLANSKRFFSLLEPHRASFAYNGLSYHFTENKCYEFDIGTTNLKTVFNIGCVGIRAITECNGWMIWMSSDKRIWAWGGAGPPIPLSWAIEDDENGEAFINAIDEDNLSSVAAGAIGNQFWFSVGNVTTYNETITNACLKGLITQNLDNVLWSVDSFPVKPVVFANVEISNKQELLFGANGVDDVYQMNVGTNDVGATTTAITTKAKMAMLDFGDVMKMKNLKELWVKHRPQAAIKTNLKLQFAFDGKTAYTNWSDPDNGTPVIENAIIDMYASDAATNRAAFKKVLFPAQSRCFLASVEFSNAVASEDFEISSIGFVYEITGPLDISPTTT